VEGEGPHPGWYYEPHGPQDKRRYWDGKQWTNQYRQVPEPVPDPASIPVDRRYHSLRTIAGIYQVLAWLVAAVGGIGVIIAAASASDSNGGLALIVGGIYVFFVVLTMLAFAAFIRLMLSVEESTRTTASAVVAMRNAQVS
jgi:hypothetical protein